MKSVKIIGNLVSTILFFTLLIMAIVVISSRVTGGEPNVFGYQLKTVLSGSMEPVIQTGSIIAVKPGGDMTRFEKGDVITFTDKEDRLITHRIVNVKGSDEQLHYITKGDHNDGPDREPVLPQNVTAEYKGFTIPYVGYLFNFADSKSGGALLLIIPGLLLIGYSIFAVWKVISEMDTRKKRETTSVD
ncbi:signal peptidase I SipW [Pseudalkalibacillus decolorationis]|uniref:signal peptidase I SipW n=1 Tax=Pseudalkalibacillus decolorationis TaxID=163879 RepID=UPI002147FE7F|nr:signal peptidase I [Pseudalkalibacillus decolorationis]